MTLPARIQAVEADRRRAGRRLVNAPGDLEPRGANGGTGLDVMILDLSEAGFRAIVPDTLPIGSWVKLSLKDLRAPEAQVKWRRDGEHGFRFAFPLYAEFVAAALSGAPLSAEETAEVEALADIQMSWADYQEKRCRVGDRLIPLSPLMTEIVSTLLMRRGEQLSGLELARAIWPERRVHRRDMATLHVLICRLHERLPGVVASLDRGSYMIRLPGQELEAAVRPS